MKLAPLIQYLTYLNDHDVHRMSKEAARTFLASAFAEFTVLSAPIPRIALGGHVDQDCAWHLEAPDYLVGDYIGSLKIHHTRSMEAAIGMPEKVRHAAAIFHPFVMEVSLFGNYHYPGGLQSAPRVQVAVRTNGGEELERMHSAICQFEDELRIAMRPPSIQNLRVWPLENACDDIANPADAGAAFLEVATHARAAARKEDMYGDDLITENVELSVDVTIPEDGSPKALEDILRIFGDIFLCASK